MDTGAANGIVAHSTKFLGEPLTAHPMHESLFS